MIIYAKLQCSHVRHQYGIFSGKSQTSFLQNATRAGSKEGRQFSQASLAWEKPTARRVVLVQWASKNFDVVKTILDVIDQLVSSILSVESNQVITLVLVLALLQFEIG